MVLFRIYLSVMTFVPIFFVRHPLRLETSLVNCVRRSIPLPPPLLFLLSLLHHLLWVVFFALFMPNKFFLNFNEKNKNYISIIDKILILIFTLFKPMTNIVNCRNCVIYIGQIKETDMQRVLVLFFIH